MKKIILAVVALAFAFAISSCCDQSYCPGNMRCGEKREKMGEEGPYPQSETPYRWDTQERQRSDQLPERSRRRW